MKKIMVVVGTRPEVVKMVPVICRLEKENHKFNLITCVTGQHRELVHQMLTQFNVKVNFNLNIMRKNQTLDYLTTKIVTQFGKVLDTVKPDLVLVQGDTTTVLTAALTCFYRRIPVGHIEAGLRSYDWDNPFPEEMNRRLTDHISTLHFTPTVNAKTNLIKENISSQHIYLTGNTVVDTLLLTLKGRHEFTHPVLRKLFAREENVAANFSLRNQNDTNRRLKSTTTDNYKYILVTAHRRENFGTPINNICTAIKKIVMFNPDVEIVYPVHPNPKVYKPVQQSLGKVNRIHLLPPLDYFDLVNLMARVYLILTDSGGIQEEAPAIGKPVLVLRKVTERPEGVRAGSAKVIGTETDKIVRETQRLLNSFNQYHKMSTVKNPYGDGHAAERICQAIELYFGYRTKKPVEFRY